MSLKTILVHIDDSERCAHRLKVAIQLALDASARLIGIYLVPGTDLSPSVAMLLPTDFVDGRQRDIGEAQHAAEGRFRSLANGAGLTRIEWRAPAGPLVAAAVEHGRCADLFVLGQRNPDDEPMPPADELIFTTLLSSGRPLLIVPHIGVAAMPGKNVLIAWDGGREAARAVADALPLLAHAKQVSVVTYTTDEDASPNVGLSTKCLEGWLQDHGIAARVSGYEAAEGGVGESLLSLVADRGSDLIVMGGYGHTRLREFVLGGVTQTILASMTVPVLMSH
jgi:nucleotide-binding universal stress UspA family protein